MFRYLYIILILFLFSCKSDGELSMERGIHYYDWKMYNEAILEFNQAKYSQLRKNKKSYDDIELLARCHYNIAITYAKMQLFQNAIQEAQQAYNLIPNKEYRELLNLIGQKLASK